MAEVAQRPATGQHILTAVEGVEEQLADQGAKIDRLTRDLAELTRKVDQLLLAQQGAPRVRHAGPADWRP